MTDEERVENGPTSSTTMPTPSSSSTETPEEKRTRLSDLIARAAAKDAIKDHNAAAELYSQATELQAELNGEMSVDNADLLFAYGKSLYNVAVSKSDVLGSKVVAGGGGGVGEPQGTQAKSGTTTTTTSAAKGGSAGATASSSSAGSTSVGENLIKNAMSSGVSKRIASAGAKTESASATTTTTGPTSKPLFQFQGDENFDDSDSDEEEDDEGKAAAAAAAGDAGGAGEDEDEDDFANAFEVLDLARILYLKKLEAAEEATATEAKGKSAETPRELHHLKERLADTYDLQAEISLEAERFADAVTDLRTALELREALYPVEDPAVAECHYKLSLALEFASVNKPEEEETGEGQGKPHGKEEVDQVMRDEAVTHMEKAIESCKLRMNQEQKKLETKAEDMDEDKMAATKRKIANVKEIIADMEQRVSLPSQDSLRSVQSNTGRDELTSHYVFQLIDLRRPPVSIEEAEKGNEAFLKGILGQIVGQSPAQQQARLDAVSKEATDLSAFVRKKTTRPPASAQGETGEQKGKRRAEESADESDSSKRARVEDAV